MDHPTPFEYACMARRWQKPADFLRAFEKAANLLHEPVTVTERQFHRWRQPVPPAPRAHAWRVLHAMFGVDPSQLGFPGPPPGATVGSAASPAQEGTDVDRRAFVADSLSVAAAAKLPPTSRDSAGQQGSIGTVHLLELAEGLRSLYHLDDAYGGGDVRSLAVRHLRRVHRIINTSSYPDTIGRQLQLLAGETAEHCAWLFYDADDQDTARRYWGEALTKATMLRDPSLEILVLASLSMQASHEGRPRDGYDLARAAQERAKPFGSPVLQSLIAVREARALSLMRDDKTAGQRLAESMRLIERGSHGRPAPEWAAFHGQAELDYAQGLLYSESGHHHAAVGFLRAALAHQDRIYGRNRALYRLTLSRGLAKSGQVDEGAAQAVESLDHLQEVESGRVVRRLKEVAGILSAVDATCARDAADRLTEYVHVRGAA
ncbi:NsdA [Streptomyces albus subsp. albus]|nr:NsdA [Streptomyces albus subsp. albus]